MLTVSSVDNIDELIVDAYNRLLAELFNASEALASYRQREVSVSMQAAMEDKPPKLMEEQPHPWDTLVEASADNPFAQNARCVINHLRYHETKYIKQLDDIRHENAELKSKNQKAEKMYSALTKAITAEEAWELTGVRNIDLAKKALANFVATRMASAQDGPVE